MNDDKDANFFEDVWMLVIKLLQCYGSVVAAAIADYGLSSGWVMIYYIEGQ